MENLKNIENDVFDFLDDFSDTNETVKDNKQSNIQPLQEVKVDKVLKNNTKTLALQGITKLQNIKTQLNTMVFEREHVINTILRGLVSGQPVLLLGEPGTGKSFLIYELTNRIEKAKYFQWLLNRTSDPAEILGPFSIKDMENDKFKRVTTGKLPEAEITFIDEVFKANEPTLNMLLPIINEKIFYNDGVAIKVPLLGFYCASNETPEAGDGLEALYDRMVNKVYVEYIKDDANKLKMFNSSLNTRKGANQGPKATIEIEEIIAIQREVNNVKVDNSILKAFLKIINSIKKLGIIFSDRRQNECIRAIQAEALLNGRDEAELEDLEALKDILWEKQTDIEQIGEIIDKEANPYMTALHDIKRKFTEISNDLQATTDTTAKMTKAIESKKSFEQLINKINKLLSGKTNNNNKYVVELNDLKEEIIQTNQNILSNLMELNQDSDDAGLF